MFLCSLYVPPHSRITRTFRHELSDTNFPTRAFETGLRHELPGTNFRHDLSTPVCRRELAERESRDGRLLDGFRPQLHEGGRGAGNGDLPPRHPRPIRAA